MKVALILLFALVVGVTANDCTVVDYFVSSYTSVASYGDRLSNNKGHCNLGGAAVGKQTGYTLSGSTDAQCFNFCMTRVLPTGASLTGGTASNGKVTFSWSGVASLTPNSFHHKPSNGQCYCNYNDCSTDFQSSDTWRAYVILYNDPYANNMRTLDTNECERHSFMTGKNFLSVNGQQYPFGCSDQNGDTVYFNSQTAAEVHNEYYGNNDDLPINLKTVSNTCSDLPLECNNGQYVTGNTCTDCPAGWAIDTNDPAACVNNAVTCGRGEFKDNDADACLTCPAGKYMSDSDHVYTECNQCGEGATNNADHTSCECAEGFTGDWSESENKCLSCSTKLPNNTMIIECPSDHACPPTHHKVLGYIDDISECCVCSNFDCAGECGGPSELVDGVCTDNAELKTLKSTGGDFVKAGKTREQVKAFTILRKDAFNDIFDDTKTSEQKKQSRKNRAAYWKEQMKDYLSTARSGKEKYLPIPKKNLRENAGDDEVAYMAVPSTDGCNERFEVTSEGLNYAVPDYDATCYSGQNSGQDIYVKCDENDAGTLVAKMTGVETFEDPSGIAITDFDVNIGVTVNCHTTTYSIQLAGSLTIEPTHVPLFQDAGSQCQHGTDPIYINKTQTEINAMNHGCVESMLEFTVFT